MRKRTHGRPRIVPAVVLSAAFAGVIPSCVTACGSDDTASSGDAQPDQFYFGGDVCACEFGNWGIDASGDVDATDATDATDEVDATDATDATDASGRQG